MVTPHRHRRMRTIAATFLLANIAAAGILTPAAAAPDGDADGGLWYYTKTGVADANTAGVRGQGVTIAIIDSQLNTSVPELQGANITIHEPSLCQAPDSWPNAGEILPATSTAADARHGTDMTSLIVGNGNTNDTGKGIQGVAPDAHVLYYAATVGLGYDEKVGCPQGPNNVDADAFLSQAINLALDDGASIISMSLSGGSTGQVSDAIARANAAGVVVVAGIGNERAVAVGLGRANGVLSVQMSGPNGSVVDSNAVSDQAIDIVSPGGDVEGYYVDDTDTWSHATASGTSNATAITAGVLALIMSNSPSATPFQALQALLRNTDTVDHPFDKDTTGYWGYGPMNVPRALAVDATQYPDENPLIDPNGHGPTLEEIEAYKTGSATPTSTPSPESSPSASSTPTAGSKPSAAPASGTNTGLVIGIVAAAVVVVGVVLVIVLAASRRKQPPPGNGPSYPPPPQQYR